MRLDERLMKQHFHHRKTVFDNSQSTDNINLMNSLLCKTFKKYTTIAPKKGVIHIGAHRCEETSLYKSLGLQDFQMLWIDGNDDLCAEFPQIINAIISDVDDKLVEFIITNNDAMSSSILELKEHMIEHPDCLEEKRVLKKTVTLDSLFDRLHIEHNTYDFLVMDIQGAELLALKGATQILPHIKCIFTEVSNKELYSQCVHIDDLDIFMQNVGFIRIASDINHHGWGDAIYIRKSLVPATCINQNIVTVEINSGLGNRLFQLAFLYAHAKANGVRPLLTRNLIKPCSEHFVDSRRYDAFYSMFEVLPMVDMSKVNFIEEPRNKPCVFNSFDKHAFYLNDKNVHVYIGYFQTEKYFEKYKDEIVSIFNHSLKSISNHMILKYPEVSDPNLMFIHVRGRDHILANNPAHNMRKINNYYEKCLMSIAMEAKFFIFTDDTDFLRSLKFVNKLTHYTIIMENELDSLFLMTQCKAGGICTNSSYSWWGSYLNPNPKKQVFMPLPFLNGEHIGFKDIYYKNVIQVNIEDGNDTNLFEDIVSTRFVEDELIITMVQKKEYPICEVRINGVIATIKKFDSTTHNDIYCTFCVFTSRNRQWASKSTLNFILMINGIEKVLSAQKSEISPTKQSLVAMTMFKDDASLIASYVVYYKKMGVDHFYMYYNDVKPISLLPQFQGVTYIQWNYPYYIGTHHYAQIGAITDFLYWSRHFTDYVIFNDLDEYIFWKGPHLTLKQFILNNQFACYGFLSNFVYMRNRHTDVDPENMYDLIENGQFEETTLIYPYGKRSKCIIDPKQIDAMGVHKHIVPLNAPKCILGFETAGIHHICNIKNRQHVSITKEFLRKI